jgi:hypothetical protein
MSVKAISDGPLEIQFAPLDPQRILILPPSDTLDVGQIARVKVQVLDERGMPMDHHGKVTLKISASAGISVPEYITVTDEFAFLDVVLMRPGIASLDFETESLKIPISGSHVELRCRAKRSASELVWSNTERHRVARRPGDGAAAVVPALPLWFAKASNGRVSVVGTEGTELSPTEALPSKNTFVIDRVGTSLRFHESNLDRPVDVRYEYRPVVGALVTTARPEDQTLPMRIEDAAARVLTTVGFSLSPDTDVVSVIGGDPGRTDLTSREIQTALDLLGLDVVFELDIRPMSSGEYSLRLTVHTSPASQLQGLARAQSASLPRNAIRDEKALHVAVRQLISKWLDSVGITFNPTVQQGR